MITHIRMKNFKSWKDSGEVRLAPLTGFFGTNSSGKSSLLQMLLLLKQTTEHADVDEVIYFGSESSLVNLGSFDEVIHGHNVERSLELELKCTLLETFEIRIIQKHNGSDNKPRVLGSISSFNFKTIMKEEEGKLNIDTFCFQALPQFNLEKVSQDTEVLFNDHRLGTVEDLKSCYGVPMSTESNLGQLLQRLSSLFEKLFTHVYYLGPSRVNPRRLYDWQGRHPGHSGQWGDKVVDALLSARVRKLNTLHETEDVPIEQRISDWLQKMDLAYSFSLDWAQTEGDTTYEVRIQKTSASPPVTLVDMGYGLSQFLPVLVLCYYAPEGSTLILEQPGIHLHPMVQSQLADLLIEVVTERKLQILVESHSEHLLTRLQLRIAEEKISSDQTALYFCENEDGTSKLTPLSLDNLGNITNWPKNFFGNVRGDLTKMTREQINRQKNAED